MTGIAARLDRRARLVERRVEALRSGAERLPSAAELVPRRPPLPGPPPRAAPAGSAPDPTVARLENLRRVVGLGLPAPPPGAPQAQKLMDRVEGHERPTPHGTCFVVERLHDPVERHGARALGAVLDRPVGAAVLTGEEPLRDFDVRRALFLDLETTGLAHGMGTLAFLIGTAHFQGPRLVFEQWLLRDPDEEQATLHDFAARLADADYLVTYNGRAFDLPLLRARFSAHKLDDPAAHLAGHLDLLHPTRRLLGHGLPDCRLATLESHRLGVHRVDDAPGSEAPARYHAYLHGEDPGPLVAIVAHNRDDVLSMVVLLDLLAERRDRAEANVLSDPECAFALAAQAVSVGEWSYAERVYGTAAEVGASADAGRAGLARVARRRKLKG